MEVGIERLEKTSDEEDSMPSQSSFLNEVKERAEVLSRNVRATPEDVTGVQESEKDDEMEQYLAIIRATETLIKNPTLMGSHAPKNTDAAIDFSCIPNAPITLNFEAQHFKASLAQRTLKRRRKPQTKVWVSSDEQAWFPKLPEGASSESDSDDEDIKMTEGCAAPAKSSSPSPHPSPMRPAIGMPGGLMADLGSMLKKRGSTKADNPSTAAKPSPKKRTAVPLPLAKPAPKTPARPPKTPKKDSVEKLQSPRKQPLLPPLPKPKTKKPAALPAGIKQTETDITNNEQNTEPPAWMKELETKRLSKSDSPSSIVTEATEGPNWLKELKGRKSNNNVKIDTSNNVDENENSPHCNRNTEETGPTQPQCKIEDSITDKKVGIHLLLDEHEIINDLDKQPRQSPSPCIQLNDNAIVNDETASKEHPNLNFIIFDGDEESVDSMMDEVAKTATTQNERQLNTKQDDCIPNTTLCLIGLDDNNGKADESIAETLKETTPLTKYCNDDKSNLSDNGIVSIETTVPNDDETFMIETLDNRTEDCISKEPVALSNDLLLLDDSELFLSSTVDVESTTHRSISPIDDFIMVDKDSIGSDFDSNSDQQTGLCSDQTKAINSKQNELAVDDNNEIRFLMKEDHETQTAAETNQLSNSVLTSPFSIKCDEIKERRLPPLLDSLIIESNSSNISQSSEALEVENAPDSSINTDNDVTNSNSSANLILWDDNEPQLSIDEQPTTEKETADDIESLSVVPLSSIDKEDVSLSPSVVVENIGKCVTNADKSPLDSISLSTTPDTITNDIYENQQMHSSKEETQAEVPVMNNSEDFKNQEEIDAKGIEMKGDTISTTESTPDGIEENPFKLARHHEKRLDDDSRKANPGKLIRVNSMEAAPISRPRVVMKRYSMNEDTRQTYIKSENDAFRHEFADNNKTNGCSDNDELVFNDKLDIEQTTDSTEITSSSTTRLVSVESATFQQPLTPERDISKAGKTILSGPDRGNKDIPLTNIPSSPPPVNRPPPPRPKPPPKPRMRKSSGSNETHSLSYKERHSEILSILSPSENTIKKLSRRESVNAMDKEVPSMINSARAYQEKQSIMKHSMAPPWQRKNQTLAPGSKLKPSVPPKPPPKPKAKITPSPTENIEFRNPWDEAKKQERQMKTMSLPVHSSRSLSRIPDEPILTEIDIKIAEAKKEREAANGKVIKVPLFIREFASKGRSRSAPSATDQDESNEPEWMVKRKQHVNSVTADESGV